MASNGRELAAIFKVRDEGGKELRRIHDEVEGLERRFASIGPAGIAAGAGIGIATTALVGMGAAAFDLGKEIDDSFDVIQARTGKLGAELDALREDFRTVAADSTASFGTVAAAIGALSARGSGGADLTKQFLDLSQLTGSNVQEDIRNVSRLFGDWSVETEQQSLTLDKLFVASQKSGASVAQLAQQAVQAGAFFRGLGVDMDSSLSMLAKWEQEGVNTEAVLSGMRQGLAKLADAGMDPRESFGRLITTIASLESETEAIGFAMDVFGKKAGADMAAAIREGRFEIEEMQRNLEEAGGAIANTKSETEDAADRMEKAFARLKLAAEPAATGVFDIAGAIVDKLIPAIDQGAPKVRSFADDLAKLVKGDTDRWGDVLGAIAQKAGSTVVPGFDTERLGRELAALGEELDRMGRAGAGTNEAELRRVADENWRAWETAQEAAAKAAQAELDAALAAGGVGAPGAGGGGPAPFDAEEQRRIRQQADADVAAGRAAAAAQRDAERAAAQAAREIQREQERAVREAERILDQQRREAEKQAEFEAQRALNLRDLGQRRADAINESIDRAAEAYAKANAKEEEQITQAVARFERERDLADERKRLQDQIAKGLDAFREGQSTARMGTQDARGDEDRATRRSREDMDLAARRAQQMAQGAAQEKADQDRINAARFAGNSIAVNQAMLAAEARKKAVKDTTAAEEAAIVLRRQREDEDLAISRARRQADREQTREDLKAAEAELARLTEPMERFNERLLADNLADQISAFARAKVDAVEAANQLLINTGFQAERQFQQGLEREGQRGMTPTQIVNLYNTNNGIQSPDALDEALEDLLEHAADLIRVE